MRLTDTGFSTVPHIYGCMMYQDRDLPSANMDESMLCCGLWCSFAYERRKAILNTCNNKLVWNTTHA